VISVAYLLLHLTHFEQLSFLFTTFALAFKSQWFSFAFWIVILSFIDTKDLIVQIEVSIYFKAIASL
jgi:hypothetical protein